LTTPEVKEKLFNQGAEAVGGSPEALGRVVKAELVKWDKVVRESGIKAE
jgi:tripartite-type tricarboxylate transporter receptor subunit TctC